MQPRFSSAVSVTLNATDAQQRASTRIVYTLRRHKALAERRNPYLEYLQREHERDDEVRRSRQAGNLGAVDARVLTVDATEPARRSACDQRSLRRSFYNATVTVRLSADDGSGSRSPRSATRRTARSRRPSPAPSTPHRSRLRRQQRSSTSPSTTLATPSPANRPLIPIDTIAPTVSLTTPTDGATVTAALDLTARPPTTLRSITSTSSPTATSSAQRCPPFALRLELDKPCQTVRIRSPRRAVEHRHQRRRRRLQPTSASGTPDTTPPTSAIACDGRLRRHLQRRGHRHAERHRRHGASAVAASAAQRTARSRAARTARSTSSSFFI